MAIIQGISRTEFSRGRELRPLLAELIDSASLPQSLKVTPEIKKFVSTDDEIWVNQDDLVAWFKAVCLNSREVVLSRPNGNTKNDWRLRICLSDLSAPQRTYLASIMDTSDPTEGNRVFLERVKKLLEKSLSATNR